MAAPERTTTTSQEHEPGGNAPHGDSSPRASPRETPDGMDPSAAASQQKQREIDTLAAWLNQRAP